MKRSFPFACTTFVALAAMSGLAYADVIIQPDEAQSKDTFVYSFLPSFNFETSGPGFQSVLATSMTSTGHNTNSLLEFDLSAFSPGFVVAGATLNLRAIDAAPLFGSAFSNPTPNAVVPLDVVALSGAWTETTVNWNNQPAPSGGVIDTAFVDGIDQWISWDVTNLVQGWIDGSIVNNGLRLSQQSEVINPDTDARVGVVFSSASGAHKPFLSIVPEPGLAGALLAGGLLATRRRRS